MKILRILLPVVVLLFYTPVYSVSISAVKSGNWSDPTVWSTGTVPQDGDDVTINNNYIVIVDQSYEYTNLPVTIGWSGSLIVPQGITLTITSFSSSNGGGNPVSIAGRLNVYGNVSQTGGTINIEDGGYFFVDGDYSTSGGSAVQLNVYGTLETNTLTTSSITVTIGPNGKIIVHGDFVNSSGATFTINGGEFHIEGNYDNRGDATITINDGGLLHIYGDYLNAGGSDIVVNDGTVIIDGNVSNQGGSTFTIADGSYVEVNGDLSNTGGGDITVDGSLYVAGDLTNRGGSTITGSGSLYVGGNIDDPQNGIEPGLLLPKDMHNIASGTWSDPSIWSSTADNAPCNCTPPINSNITITANTQVNLDNIAKIKTLTVEDGAEFTLDDEANVTVFEDVTLNGTLVLQNSLTSSPNFLVQGNIVYGPNVQIITKLTVGADKYNYLGNYIPGVPTSILKQLGPYENPNVYQYDETQADNWEDADPSNDYTGWVEPADTMTPGQGFIVYTDQVYTYTFTGTKITKGTVNVDVTLTIHSEFANSNSVDGWNLIANPYPASIDAQSFLNDNSAVLDGNVYLWDDDRSAGTDYSSSDYIQYNSTGTIVNSANGTDFNGKIAPNQAFFVKAIATGQVVFKPSQMSEESSRLLKATMEEDNDMRRLWLAMTNGSLYNETLIAFSSFTTDGFDAGYDGLKRQGNEDIAFYSMLDSSRMGIQALSDTFDVVKRVALGYRVAQPGEYTVYLKNYNTPLSYKLMLYDALTGQYHNLVLSPYTFSTEAGEFNDRLFLVVEKRRIATATAEELLSPDFRIYAANGKLFVSNLSSEPADNVQMSLIDMQGRVVLEKRFDLLPNSTEITDISSLQAGVYVVRLQTGRSFETQKISIVR